MLFFCGLGLGDAEDITVKGLKIVKEAKIVYLESYTSILTVGKEELEKFYGRELIVADREFVEQQADEILENAKENDVAFLVVGDPFGATTHSDLILRAIESNVPYRVIHNASIMNAVGCCGLQLYSFGETITIPFWTDDWQPDSFYDKIKRNRERGLHTLCLLDIKMKEQTVENLIRGRKVYEPPRFMSVNQAASQLMQIIVKKKEAGDTELGYSEDTQCVGLARVGSDNQKIVVASLNRMASTDAEVDLGGPLHSMVIPGTELHPLELDMLRIYAHDKPEFDQIFSHIKK
jgi:diphthine synthase